MQEHKRSMFLFMLAIALVAAAFWVTDNWVARGVMLALALATAWRSLGDYERAYVEAAGRALSGEASRADERILGDLGRAACALVHAEAARDAAVTYSTPVGRLSEGSEKQQERAPAAAPSA
jgi:hypothetical protein